MTGEEVFNRMVQKIDTIKSANVKQEMTQQLLSADNTLNSKTCNYFDIQITLVPFAVHTKETTDTTMAGIQGKIPKMFTEIFFVDDVIYISSDYHGNEREWFKKADMSDDMVEKMKEKHLDPKEHFNKFKQYIDNLSLKQSKDLYILKLKVDESIKSFTEFAKQTMKSNIFSDDLVETEMRDSLENITFNSMSLTLVINKESFIIKTYDVKMDIILESGGEKSHLVQTMNSEYSNFNNVGLIEVPETAKINAIQQ